MERGHLVASLNFRTPNPAIPDFLDDFEVLSAPGPGPAHPAGRAAPHVSAFGMGGTNAHVILEQAPTPAPAPQLPANEEDMSPAGGLGTLPWVLSARTPQALAEQAARLRDHVAADPSLSAADVGHSLLATRARFEHRAVVLGESRQEALEGLALLAAGRRRGPHGPRHGERREGPGRLRLPRPGIPVARHGQTALHAVTGLRPLDRRLRQGS